MLQLRRADQADGDQAGTAELGFADGKKARRRLGGSSAGACSLSAQYPHQERASKCHFNDYAAAPSLLTRHFGVPRTIQLPYQCRGRRHRLQLWWRKSQSCSLHPSVVVLQHGRRRPLLHFCNPLQLQRPHVSVKVLVERDASFNNFGVPFNSDRQRRVVVHRLHSNQLKEEVQQSAWSASMPRPRSTSP